MQQQVWIVYRDVEDFPRKQFEVMPPPAGGLVIKPMVLPGAFGYPDTHIRVRVGMIESTVINLIAYTELKLREAEVVALIGQAYEFASSRN